MQGDMIPEREAFLSTFQFPWSMHSVRKGIGFNLLQKRQALLCHSGETRNNTSLSVEFFQRRKGMTTNSRSTIVGVFRDRTMAEQAMKAVQEAGFGRDQIRYAGGGNTGGASGGFLEGIKSLFTGQETTSGDVTNDLRNMGLTDDEARYYAHEYSNGHPILAVNGYAQPGSYPPAETMRPATTPEAQPTVTQPQYQASRPPENQQVASTASPGDQFQATQAQLQTVQRQLQEARAQLQAAKQREAELQAARQRDSQFHDLQRQLQEAQAQLQSTQAELQATQARIAQGNQ
jgi:hypothetical protein